MNRTGQIDWYQANQQYLLKALEVLRRRLLLYEARRSAEAVEASPLHQAQQELERVRREMPGPPALETLAKRFGLIPFEQDILLLCAAAEMDFGFTDLFARIQPSPAGEAPTFSLALAILDEPQWNSMLPTAPLRYWRMVEVTGAGLTGSPLRLDERILHFLTGLQHLDERLTGFIYPMREGNNLLVPSHRALAEQIAGHWHQADKSRAWPVIQLTGRHRTTMRAIVREACAGLGMGLYHLPVENLPTQPGELNGLLRLWERESILSGAALLVECPPEMGPESEMAARLQLLMEHTGGPLLLTALQPLPPVDRPCLRLEVGAPDAREQWDLWKHLVPGANGDLESLTTQFHLEPEEIHTAAHQALAMRPFPTPDDATVPGVHPGGALWEACKQIARPRLDDLAQRVISRATWEDLVLPPMQQQILEEITLHLRHRHRVYEQGGFAEKNHRGLGISALFAGPSGTGKTLAAEVIANELGLDLYRIDLSSVVSKYIGETEKNLRRVFDAAESGGAVLLFDEADALFGKRTEVKDSHDRYANIEVSYLLQRMEAYRGLAILTTNLKDALDPAFLRRIRFVVQFPFPDEALRVEIWKRIFPPQTRVEGLDMHKLARLPLTGGNIHNIALKAAFFAAGEDRPVQMRHIRRGVESEFAKLEKVLPKSELEGWT